jgi:hypothetical protein
MFEKAARLKLRFPFKGSISVEELWDLPVSDLDQIYRTINKDLKGLQEDSLLKKQTKASETLELQVSIVKHIVSTKVAEAKEKENVKAKKEQALRLDEIIARKEGAALEGKTIEELKAMRESL